MRYKDAKSWKSGRRSLEETVIRAHLILLLDRWILHEATGVDQIRSPRQLFVLAYQPVACSRIRYIIVDWSQSRRFPTLRATHVSRFLIECGLFHDASKLRILPQDFR